jgi:hypothetical protein
MLVDAGVLRPQQTALDLTLRHVQALTAAYGTLARWWPQPGLQERPLGDLLKVMPEQDARLVLQLLWWGGWVYEAPEAEAE